MQAKPIKLLDLFGNTLRYVVPIFQRHYVWGKDAQWEPLWEDIEEKLWKRLIKGLITPHFLGALILDQVRKKSTKEVSRFLVIDGQQRLITTQLLIAALRDVSKERNYDNLSTAITRYILNPDPELMENSEEEIYKLWPTQFNREVFCNVISAGSCIRVNELFPIIRKKYKRRPEPRDSLVEAYDFFINRIRASLEKKLHACSEEDILMELFGVLKDDFAVVEILLDVNDDSQEIFHSLNSQGKALSQSDLLRSFIFMRAEKGQEDRDSLYNEYWKYFEEPFWDQWTRRGNQWASHLDTITRIFLSSKKGETIDAKKLHLAYKDWITLEKPYLSVRDELLEYNKYGRRYRFLIESNEEDVFGGFTNRLRIFDVSTIYPLVVYLFEESNFKELDLLRCFNDLESFLVRRLICNKLTKEYNKFFVEIISRMRNGESSPDLLREILNEGGGETREWPNDEEFYTKWVTEPLYSRLTSQQIISIYKMIENKMRTSKSETIIINQASVEHIMPQKWAEHYMLDGHHIHPEMASDWYSTNDEIKKREWEEIKERVRARNKMIHTIGNLTIVTQPLNAALSNGPFEAKKNELLHSSLMLNHYFRNVSAWDESTIKERAELLFKYAVSIWPHPSS